MGDTKYKYYQEAGGYDLLKVTSRLSVYKKKMLQKATHIENSYTLDPVMCRIIFQMQTKESKKE